MLAQQDIVACGVPLPYLAMQPVGAVVHPSRGVPAPPDATRSGTLAAAGHSAPAGISVVARNIKQLHKGTQNIAQHQAKYRTA